MTTDKDGRGIVGRGLCKSFGDHLVLDRVDLDVEGLGSVNLKAA